MYEVDLVDHLQAMAVMRLWKAFRKKLNDFFLNVVLQTLPKNVAPSENEFFRQQSGTSQLEKQHEKEKKKKETKIYIRKGLWQFDMHSHGRCVKRFREPEKKKTNKKPLPPSRASSSYLHLTTHGAKAVAK